MDGRAGEDDLEGKILVDIYLQRVPLWVLNYRGDSSVGKESTCNAGDPSLIPGLGRSTGKGIGYPLQYPGLENSMAYRVHGVAKSQI